MLPVGCQYKGHRGQDLKLPVVKFIEHSNQQDFYDIVLEAYSSPSRMLLPVECPLDH